MNKPRMDRLTRLLEQPTAPFREQHIVAHARALLDRYRIPHFSDRSGNLVVGVGSADAYARLLARRMREPLRVLVAHMDHPGFHGVRWRKGELEAVWHGGSPVKRIVGSRVWLADDSGHVGDGKIARARMHASGRRLQSVSITAPGIDTGAMPATSLFGGFGFRRPVWRSGKRIYTRAADDLVGVFAVLESAIAVFRAGRRPPFLGLLTRGEEVGFVGAVAHLEDGWLRGANRSVVFVSLETSRTLPGANIGKGPVVRLGDRRTVFDPDATRVLLDVAETCLKGRHQRRIMDGGVCEATAATAWGVPAIGLSVPLGNYHNQGLEGGPDCRGNNAPAPEFVHEDDVDGLLRLCRGLLQAGLAWRQPWRKDRTRLLGNAAHYRHLL